MVIICIITVNGRVWRQTGPQSSWDIAAVLLQECSNRPVTLTQFLKMQPPVEPTSLLAATFAERTGRRRTKTQSERRKGKEQSRTGWYNLHILWLEPNKLELLQMREEEEETNKTHWCAAYSSLAFQEHRSPVCEQLTGLQTLNWNASSLHWYL